jgi:hypothetical protein
MPIGQEPKKATTGTAQDSTAIKSTQGLKVYYSTLVSQIKADKWWIDKNLIPNIITKMNGGQVGTCAFDVLRDASGDSNGLIDSDDDITRGNSINTYNTDTSDKVYKHPYYVKVTDKVKIKGKLVETPIFFGFINEVEYDISTGTSVAVALSYAELLDSVDLFGGWWNTGDDPVSETPRYFDRVMPIFNPNGEGNMSEDLITLGKATPFHFFNEILIKNNYNNNLNNDFKWGPKDILDMIVGMTVPETEASHQGGTIFSFVSGLYGDSTKDTFIKYSAGALNKLIAAPKVKDYSYFGKSMYSAIVELVTSVDTLGITEIISNGKPYLYVTETNIAT